MSHSIPKKNEFWMSLGVQGMPPSTAHQPRIEGDLGFGHPVTRPRELIAAVAFVICLVATPPGLCPCWLMFDPSTHHPHFDNHPELPHQHGYLLDYFQLKTIVTLPSVSIPAVLLIALQAASGLLTSIAELAERRLAWSPLLPFPPPR